MQIKTYYDCPQCGTWVAVFVPDIESMIEPKNEQQHTIELILRLQQHLKELDERAKAAANRTP